MVTKVSIVRCGNYVQENVDSAIRKSLAYLGGIRGIVKPGDKVLLKVNLLAPTRPEEAVTTHPAIVSAVIDIVKEAGGIPIVGDRPSYLVAGGKEKAIDISGIKKIAESKGVKAIQFESEGFIKLEVPKGKYTKNVFVARTALEANVIISLPKLKTHSMTLFTGAVKNMFGIVAPKSRKVAHTVGGYKLFSETIVDIYSIAKPKLAIMDAVMGREGEKPTYGGPKNIGLILSSYDCVALDAVASKIIGFNPMEIHTTRSATLRGLGNGKLSTIQILGEDTEDVKVVFKKPTKILATINPFLARFGYLVRAYPWINKKVCNRCGACIKFCPVNGINLSPSPQANQRKCIQCYSCYELCPVGAIKIRKTLLARIVRY